MTAAMTAGAEPRARLLRRAIRLEQFSVAWMLIEAGVGRPIWTRRRHRSWR